MPTENMPIVDFDVKPDYVDLDVVCDDLPPMPGQEECPFADPGDEKTISSNEHKRSMLELLVLYKLMRATFDRKDYTVDHILINQKKGKTYTTVYFKDGDVVVLTLASGDKDSIYNAVAIAICEKMFGSNSAFTRMVNNAYKEYVAGKGKK